MTQSPALSMSRLFTSVLATYGLGSVGTGNPGPFHFRTTFRVDARHSGAITGDHVSAGGRYRFDHEIHSAAHDHLAGLDENSILSGPSIMAPEGRGAVALDDVVSANAGIWSSRKRNSGLRRR